jgi:hypothetical protein
MMKLKNRISILLLVISIFFIDIGIVNAQENGEIGYAFLNSTAYEVPPSEAETVHMWNTRDNYYFNKSSGMQFTNHFKEYWSKNIFCLGYYSGDEWIKISCVDELDNFNRNIITDNITYVNATLWKYISYGAYDIRMGIRYHLLVNDTNLSVIISGENIGIDIPFDVGFAWIVKNVSLPGLGEDYIEVDGIDYYLNETRTESFINLTNNIYHFHDLTKYMDLAWSKNLNYRLNLSGTNQDDFRAILMINAGTFISGQKKQTTLTWIDADTVVESDPHPSIDQKNALHGPYWLNTTTGIIVYVNGPDTDMAYTITNDGGATWAESTIEVGSGHRPSVWFDQETPGDSGTNLNIFWIDHTTNGANDSDAKFVTVDVATGTIGTIRTVNDSITTTGFHQQVRTGMTKTVSGNIIACLETQVEIECYKSTDLFASDITAIANAFESTSSEDSLLLFPADTGDNNDAVGIFWDNSDNEISVKMYDDSMDTWNETLISGSMTIDTNNMGYDGSIRLSDNHILLVAHSNNDFALDDLMTWDLTVNSIASPTVTARTNIFTDQGESAQTGMLINQQNDDVYVSYLKGGTWGTAVDVVYHISTDGMVNWGSEINYSETTDDYRIIHGGRTVGNNGGRVQWSFFDDDDVIIYVNLVNDIEIDVAIPPVTPNVTVSVPIHSFIIFKFLDLQIPHIYFMNEVLESLTFKVIILFMDRLTVQGDIDAGGNVNVSGNLSGNMYYGEMWNYTPNVTAWDFQIDDANVYYNLSNINNASNRNGFDYVNNDTSSGGSYLISHFSGLYRATASVSLEASENSGLYALSVANDFVPSNTRNCYARNYLIKNQAKTMAISCLIRLHAGDIINMMIENEVSNRDVRIHAINLNLVRIGD